MSVEVRVYLHSARLPSREEWQAALGQSGAGLELHDFSPCEHAGFLPTVLNGQECGFEYSLETVNRNELKEILAEIDDRDRVATFNCHSSELELRAAVIAAASLAQLTDGVYFDPQSGEFARGESVFRLLDRQDADERDQRMRTAVEKWAGRTNRRCPNCGAPCPEYKKSCVVCEFAIGRA